MCVCEMVAHKTVNVRRNNIRYLQYELELGTGAEAAIDIMSGRNCCELAANCWPIEPICWPPLDWWAPKGIPPEWPPEAPMPICWGADDCGW